MAKIKIFGNTESKSNPSIAIKTCSKCGFEKRAEVIGDCTKCGSSEFKTSVITLDQLAKEVKEINDLTRSKIYCMGSRLDNLRELLRSNRPKQKENKS